jgi:hypothetical protein
MFSEFHVRPRELVATEKAAYYRLYRQKNKEKISLERKKRRREKKSKMMEIYITLANCASEREKKLREWNVLLDQLEYALSQTRLTKNSRKKFKLAWCFSIGFTSNANTLSCFEEPHQIRTGVHSNRGICLTDPMNKSHSKVQKNLFQLGTKVFSFMLPESCQKQYVIQFSKMDSSQENLVGLHKDKYDISHQYVVHVGKWTGAKLVCYSSDSTLDNLITVGSFDQPRSLVACDGRLFHQVLLDKFNGVRYSIILYQSWHEEKYETDPILEKPFIVNS